MVQTAAIYQGSQAIIKKPVFCEGNPRNDYGLGFYCTHEINLAKEWACTEENSGYANQHELELTGLSLLLAGYRNLAHFHCQQRGFMALICYAGAASGVNGYFCLRQLRFEYERVGNNANIRA